MAGQKVPVLSLTSRSQSAWLDQSECKNAELARTNSDEGGQVLLDPGTGGRSWIGPSYDAGRQV